MSSDSPSKAGRSHPWWKRIAAFIRHIGGDPTLDAVALSEQDAAARPYVLLVDSKFPGFVHQVQAFFDNGFLDRSSAVVVCKRYPRAWQEVARAARTTGIPLFFFDSVKELSWITRKTILYPFNAQLNAWMTRQRDSVHVFLSHGESNKVSSVNPMCRIYDAILTSGDIGADRYREFLDLPRDLASTRLVCIGRSLIDASSVAALAAPRPVDATPAIVYMPTWEGGDAQSDYSSVDEAHTAEILGQLCTRLAAKAVVVKAHPNLGRRCPGYRNALHGIVTHLQARGLEVRHLVEAPAAGSILHGLRIVHGVVDVSAAEAMLAALGIESLVLVKQGLEIFAPQSYLDLRRHALIRCDAAEWQQQLKLAVGLDQGDGRFTAYCAKLIRSDISPATTLAIGDVMPTIVTCLSRRQPLIIGTTPGHDGSAQVNVPSAS